MTNVRIVTDSSAEITQDAAKRLGVTVVPHNVHIGPQVLRDGIDVTGDQVCQWVVESGRPPRTSPPSLTAFRSVYQELTQSPMDIVSIHVSGKLSDTVRHAAQASAYFLGYGRITVIDSRLTSWGLGLLVIEAAQAAATGATSEEIVRRIRGMIPRTYVVFYADQMKCGRVAEQADGVVSLDAGAPGLKPLFIVEDGENAPLGTLRTEERAVDRLYEFVIEFPSLQHVSIVHGLASGQAHELRERLTTERPEQKIELRRYGAAMAADWGPDCLGVVVYEG